jgi:ribonuclease P/MRP protein subunit POP1
MKNDNTPTVSARRRKPSPHMRLRLETAKKLQKLGALTKKKGIKSKEQEAGETVPEKTVSLAPRPPKVKKNALTKPAKPASKFRKRQIHKSWLPTHLYHAKRAHMTAPKESLWRFAIPLTPTDKCYRATHRAGSERGCVAWDTSYMSTIGVEGAEESLLGLLRGLGVEENMVTGKRERKWRRGSRGWKGWIRERDGEKKWISKVSVVWCVENMKGTEPLEKSGSAKKPMRKLFIRVHPSAFLQVWNETLKVSKIQRPPAMVEDLRFEIGSIEVTGPGSTETLISTLQPVATIGKDPPDFDRPEDIWPRLVAVTNPASLPSNALLGFNVCDPRLHYPPRTLKCSSSPNANEELLHTLSAWSPDTTQLLPNIFSGKARFEASRLLPSQKSINRRKGAALPGAYPDPLPRDPQIPVLLLASRSSSTSTQGSWTLLLPWKSVLPVWYSIMHYPLSSGGNPRFGGLREKRQLAFEQGVPWFPGDFPGTSSGWEWECMEREKRKAEWEKRPKGKRVQWESVDLGEGRKGEVGRGWACDWERLFEGPPLPASNDSENTEPRAPKVPDPAKPAGNSSVISTSPPTQPTSSPTPPLNVVHIPFPHSSDTSPLTIPPTALTIISLTLLSRGTPTPCTRIYGLPTKNPSLRSRWLALASPPKPTRTQKVAHRRKNVADKDIPDHLRNQQLAAWLIAPPLSVIDENIRAGSPAYPSVPDEEDLIGFVTTGNFNLGEGRSTAIGSIALARVIQDGNDLNLGKEQRLCILREAGQGLGRLARWEFV